MLKHIACLIALLGIAQGQSGEDLRGLLRVAVANLDKADKQLATYSYKRMSVRSELANDGSVKGRKESVTQVSPKAPRRGEDRSWLKEFPDALDYKKIGEEEIAGRTAWVLEFSPRAGYKPNSLRARVFEKTRGKLWIDAGEPEVVRVDATVFDTVSIGWGLAAKIQKGTRFQVDRRRSAEGVWLPESQTIRFAARVMMVKSLGMEEAVRFSEYRRN